MTLSLDTRQMGSSMLGSSMSASPSLSPRNGLSSSQPARLHKHRRRPSNASTASNKSPAITQFPTFDPTFENAQATTYYTSAPQEPMPLFKQSRGDGTGSANHGSSFSKKIKPLVKYTNSSIKETKPLDLSLSRAENEERGAYVADSPPMTSDSPANMHSSQSTYTANRAHSRTLSGTSQISSSSAHSGHRIGTSYMHPHRQVPHSPTPPISTSLFEPPGVLRPESSQSSLTNIPALPSSNNFRSSTISALRTQTSTPTNCPTPALVPSAPATARSSFDSAFRDRVSFSTTRKSRRPSRNKEPMDIEEEQLEVMRLRQQFATRQEKKNEKYRLQEEKKALEEERKARRRSEAAGSARSKRNAAKDSRQRGDSDGTIETMRTLDTIGTGAAESTARVTSNRRKGAPSGGSARVSADRLSAVGYASTSELGRPKMGRRATTEDDVDEADEAMGEKVPIPKRQKTQGAASAGKAAKSRWSLFWFQVKTVLLKAFRK